GVSGSGKSTLIRNCLYNRYQRDFRGATGLDVGTAKLEGVDQIYDMQFVDQSPIGRSSRSNPATYIKAWDEIRKLLAETTHAKLHGVTAGMFSFNTTGGRCEVCEGAGTVTIDMQFLADVEVVCEKCNGRRFDEQTTGLHSSDVKQLIKTLKDLIERGNSVIVIEHNIQLIEAADHVIDLGPEGGDGGGEVVATGTPEDIAANPRSITGRYLLV